MHTEGDVTRIVRSWLRTDEHESAERVIADVLALLDTATAPVLVARAEDRRRVNMFAKLAIAAAAVAVLAVVGINALPSSNLVGGPPASTSPSLASTPPEAAATPTYSEILPGSFIIPWQQLQIHLTMPAGWGSFFDGTGIEKIPRDGLDPKMSLWVNDVTYVATDVCGGRPNEGLVKVGPRVEDLTTALANQVGIQRSGPTDEVLGGYPAKRFVLTQPTGCSGTEGRQIWANGPMTGGLGLWLVDGATATIHVVDVKGHRLVIASADRGSPAEDVVQLNGIVASIDIEGRVVPLAVGRHSLTVDGVPFSFSVSTHTDDGWADYGGVSINKSISGPQTAEGIIYWTGFPDGAHTDPCGQMLRLQVGSSAADVAEAVAIAPGIELVERPSDVTVGGRPAKHVVVIVREDVGCDPGYFFSWYETRGGPFWGRTYPGDTINVWIVDVDGTRLFIASEIHRDDYPGASGPDVLTETEKTRLDRLEQEIQQIVDSIRFE
jgi:hypothetical protein